LRAPALLALAALLALVAAPAAAEDELDLAKVQKLKEDGKKHFDASANVDLSTAKRNEHRKQSYDLLTEAWEILDAWCTAPPEDSERLEDLLVEIHQMRYWLRKESPVGLLEDDDANVRKGRPPDWPERPASEPAPEPAPPGPARAPKKPEKPRPRTKLEIVRDYEKHRPHDHAGALEMWLEILEELSDPTAAEYSEALGRVAELSAKLKEAYRRLRNEDPDSIESDRDPGREAAIAERLSAGLLSEDPEERARAADRLAALGHTPAAAAIQKALRIESDAGVRERCFLALVRLGGRRTCETLAKLARERKPDLPLGGVRALGALGKRGPVQGRYAGLSLAEFVVRSRLEAVKTAALDALEKLVPHSVPGLVEALETKDSGLRVRTIGILGDAQDVRAASALSEHLVVKGDVEARDAAVAALKKIGRPAVPALIAALKKRKTRQYAAVTLYEITGETFGEDARAWARWWSKQ
jgi:HEAT repeat protein